VDLISCGIDYTHGKCDPGFGAVEKTVFEAFKTSNATAIEAAAKAGTDAADVVDGKLTEYKTSNDAALDAVRTTANAAAKKADVDSAFEAVNGAIEALEGEAALHAKQADLEAEIDRATKAEAKALEDAKKYADDIKSDPLGESETLEGTYDTLKEIAGWISTHEGETVVELTTAIADEAKAREEADTALSNRIKAYEDVKDTYATVSALEEVEAIADAARTEAEVNAQIDAKITALNLANTYEPKGAESRANAYADSLAGNYATKAQGAKADSALQSVAAGTGLKVSAKANNSQTIEIDEAVVFVFNCGSSTELV
jgi:hypothetical protein